MALIALLVSTAAAAAEPTEPLTVTRLDDGESELVVSMQSSEAAVPDGSLGAFSQAIREAVRAQQESMQARCESASRGTGSIAARSAWEARCRYRRY